MKLILLTGLLASSLAAQTTIYARASGPQGQQVLSATAGTPPVITTATAHGLSVGDIWGMFGACSGNFLDPNSARSPLNGIFKVASVPSSTTFTINDLSNHPVVLTANSVGCNAFVGGQVGSWFGGKLTGFTRNADPVGYWDGATGPMTRRLALTTLNGLTTLVVNFSHVATATTSYAHGVVNGQNLAVWGSLNSTLNNGNAGSTAYTAQNVTTNTFDFPVDPSIPAGTYSNQNNNCGPALVPNDTIGGTQDCLVISQLAYTGNPFWDALISRTNTDYTANGTNSNAYKSGKDGGTQWHSTTNYNWPAVYGLAGFRFVVDRQNTMLMSVGAYAINTVEQMGGVNWLCVTEFNNCNLQDFIGNMDATFGGLAEFAPFFPYMSSAHLTTFANKMYNDIDYSPPASAAHYDASFGNQNKSVVSGTVQAGTSTSVTLGGSASSTDGFYVGNMVALKYVTSVVSITTGTNTIIQTASDWGINSFYQVTLSGITGTGTCSQLNVVWQGNGYGLTAIDSTHFSLNFNTTGCSNPTGGTATSFPLCEDGAASPCLGLITAYVGSTKVATVSGGFNANSGAHGYQLLRSTTPLAGQVYTIYETITASSLANRSTGVTITGINTHFTADVAVGDAVFGANGWGTTEGFYELALCYVSAVTNDTHLTAMCESPSSEGSLDTVIPSLLWISHAWAPGDVGLNAVSKHWTAFPGTQPVLYRVGGGVAVGTAAGTGFGSNNGINSSFTPFSLGVALAPYDNRAVLDAARHQMYGFDFELQHYMTYLTGPVHSGTTYGNGVTAFIGALAHSFIDNLPGFPAIDTGWLMHSSLWKTYSILPDLNSLTSQLILVPMGYATETGDDQLASDGRFAPQAYLLDPIFQWAPTSNNAKQLRYVLESVSGADLWAGATSAVNYEQGLVLLHNAPNAGTPTLNPGYQPLQYAFLTASAGACAALTGWACPASVSGSSYLSRTSWTDRAATLTYFGARAWAGDHDIPQNGMASIYKVGGLVAGDSPFNLYASNGFDMTMTGDMFRFGNTNRNVKGGPTVIGGVTQYGIAPITQWASSNHGTWDPQYGDQSSKYAHACADLSGAYNTGTTSYALRCVTDLKDTTLNGNTGEQVVFLWNDVNVSGAPTQVEMHQHYLQNGQPPYYGGTSYTEGNTTCPGLGGCAALNANRTVQSMEDGSGPDAGSNNPQRRYGVISKFFSPGTVTLRDDAPPVTVSSVIKTTISSISSFTPGAHTVIQTSAAHGAVVNEHVVVAGVAGTGTCNGSGAVLAVPDSTHVTVQYNSSTCSGASGGTVTTPTLFNVPGEPLYTASAITGFSVGSTSTITTATPHGLVAGQAFQFIGVSDSNAACEAALVTQAGLINTGFYVLAVNNPTQFTVSFSTMGYGCAGPIGGIVSSDYNHTVTINGATGSWSPLNTTKVSGGIASDSVPAVIWPIDANTFSLYNGPDTSGYSGAFNGNVNGEYFNGYGWSHRISVCGGPSCGSSVNNFRALIVHKIAQNLSDTVLTATPIVPDSNWFGVQTKDKVAIFGVGGTHGAMAGFTTTHSGTAQYLFGGLTPGTYTVSINNAPVTGSPFTVAAGDNSIHFESAAGTVSVNGRFAAASLLVSPGSLSYSCVSGGSNPVPQTVNISADNNALDNWSASNTQSWLTLSPATGTAAGSLTASVNCTGQAAGNYTDTITVSSTTAGITNSPQTVAVSLSVSAAVPAPSGVNSTVSGRATVSGTAIIH